MTQDEIIEMPPYLNASYEGDDLYTGDQVRELMKLVAAKEREACAILCDNRRSFYWNWQAENLQKHEENRHYAKASEECADAIRARGEQA